MNHRDGLQEAIRPVPTDGSVWVSRRWPLRTVRFLRMQAGVQPEYEVLTDRHGQPPSRRRVERVRFTDWHDWYRPPEFDIRSDGRTVWVHSDTGHTVGRFGPMGVDVHTPDSTGCLDCTHGATGPREWDRFVTSMFTHYGVRVDDEHRPDYTVDGA